MKIIFIVMFIPILLIGGYYFYFQKTWTALKPSFKPKRAADSIAKARGVAKELRYIKA